MARELNRVEGRTVVYSRNSLSVTLTAVKGQSIIEAVDNSGFSVTHKRDDWRILVADLQLNGVAVEPQQFDRITETAGGKTWIYEVTPAADPRPFQIVDRKAGGYEYRVHSVLISVS